jgi:hypothetical protein
MNVLLRATKINGSTSMAAALLPHRSVLRRSQAVVHHLSHSPVHRLRGLALIHCPIPIQSFHHCMSCRLHREIAGVAAQMILIGADADRKRPKVVVCITAVERNPLRTCCFKAAVVHE